MTDPTAPLEGEVLDRPEPVLAAAKLAGLVGALVVAVLGLIAIIVSGQAGDLTAVGYAVSAVLTAGAAAAAGFAPYWQALKARAKVTPLDDPRTADGGLLVPASTVATYLDEPQVDGVPDHDGRRLA